MMPNDAFIISMHYERMIIYIYIIYTCTYQIWEHCLADSELPTC